MALENLAKKYPRNIGLTGGGDKVQVRFMGPPDRDAILRFARNLPEEDLLFLRTDITNPETVDEWIANIERGLSATLVAYSGDTLAGYASVHRNPARWTRRVGEIRVNVGPLFRSKGLGRNLTAQIVDVARALDLKKLTANMTADQAGARAAFRRLGFKPEAMLADYVEDRDGKPRDLMIMSYDLDGLTDRMDEPVHV
jgi:L-amino acid N-acyltransferase YncA